MIKKLINWLNGKTDQAVKEVNRVSAPGKLPFLTVTPWSSFEFPWGVKCDTITSIHNATDSRLKFITERNRLYIALESPKDP